MFSSWRQCPVYELSFFLIHCILQWSQREGTATQPQNVLTLFLCPLRGANPKRPQSSSVLQMALAGRRSSRLPRYSPRSILFFYSLGSFPTAINLIFGTIKGHHRTRVRDGAAEESIQARLGGVSLPQDPRRPPRSALQARRCSFAPPNAAGTFCSGLTASAWALAFSRHVTCASRWAESIAPQGCASSDCLPSALKYLLHLLLLGCIHFGRARSHVLSEFSSSPR